MKSEFAQFVESLPEELKNIPEVFFAPYGFKLIEIQGKKLWMPGTFEEYQQVAAKIMKVDPSTVKTKEGYSICYNSSPTTCAGSCGQYLVCGGEAPGGYVACGCFS